MTNLNLATEATIEQINDAQMAFCPFGSLDIQKSVNVSLKAGKSTDFLYDSVLEFSQQCEAKIEDCDPVYCVMDAILQEARNEINKLCNFDFCNDLKSGSIDTYGNFICSSYQCDEEAKNQLKKVLKKNKIVIEDLSKTSQYFLSEIEL